VLRGVGQRPVLAVLVGAVAIAFSGILFRLSHVSASTGAFYRCVFALPPLWLLARLETRRYGRPKRRAVGLAWVAGAFFAADLILWHNALEQGAYGSNPGLGALYGVLTAIAYSGFLLVLREGSRDLRRPAGPLCMATVASALGCAAIGAAVGDLDLTPSWAAIGWLIVLALSAQVLGWLLISTSLPRLPAVTSSILLTFQPLCSVVFAALIVDESPSLLQLGGAVCILVGLVTATVGRREVPTAEPELAG